MDAYVLDNNLNISVTNYEAFKNLLEKAEQEATQLSKTLQELKTFSIEFRLDVTSAQ